MCQRKPIYASIAAMSVTGVVALSLLSDPVVMAASTPAPYTVTVSGSWSASFSSSLVAHNNSGENAPPVEIPAGKAFTPTGTVTITIPAVPVGDSYDGGSWSFSAPGLLTNAWCPTVLKTWKIPASGGTITEPTADLFGTMPASSNTPSPCVIGVQAPTLLNKSGYTASTQIPIFYLGLPVKILEPTPKPTPTPSPSPTPTPTPSSSPTPTPTSSPTPTNVPSTQAPPSSATPTPSRTATPTPKTTATPAPSVTATRIPKATTAPSTTPRGSRDTKPSRGVTTKATAHPARVWTWGILLLLLVAAGVMGVILIRRRNAGK